MDIILIRHAKTKGNINKKYIGTTDESLCSEGIEELKNKKYFKPEIVYSSPMKRCIETSEIIFPKIKPVIIENLKECDFGEFENKNYIELSDNENYQKWIDSNGTLPFPDGETIKEFKERTIKGFLEAVKDAEKKNIKNAAFVVHGGTIMAVLDRFSNPHKDYYSWQVKNCCGYSVSSEILEDGKLILKVNYKI